MAELLINYAPYETRVALVEGGQLVEFYVERPKEKGVVGNIYKGRVVRVLPGMKAAFVEVGLSRTAFLYGGDFLPILEGEELLGESAFVSDRALCEVLREGQEILVQVIKEPVGSKGARLSTNITLPGHYLVYLPYMSHIGISRKIKDEAERERLRSIVEEARPPGTGWIVRTAAEGASAEEIKPEMEFLLSLWEEISTRAERSRAPALIYEELEASLRAVRDLLTREVSSVVIDDREEYRKILDFLSRAAPHLKGCVRLHEGPRDLFETYGLEVDPRRLLSPRVWLKSGGFIVIEPCEAFTAIDVNTGRFVGRRDLEETVFRTNLEAAREIAYQLRLRNIGGLIVIDFIDMEDPGHREEVYQTLKEALKRDRAKTSVKPISDFGLLEMTRERRRESLYEVFLERCPCCGGEGRLKSRRTIGYEIFRRLERMGPHIRGKVVEIRLHPEMAEFLAEEMDYLGEIESRYGFELTVSPESDLPLWEYKFFIKNDRA
ncbi:Rne/Rng family ribonuclease [Thermosulfurimonas sp. F29]|uniref:Rne/Rng family ribonuclease n=1 Tax=Thermosulfurimonas sp. F29 TaxID=2867247 RepID=UPI001C82FA6F|nr:Rne/Rng family ribonuclease [Thermosulfurimonas sp. F29]MBX6422997.1 Rne/Rng family ribonuclease [Thermosulfurimonas sp. F29]